LDTIFLASTILLWVVVLFNLFLTLALIRRVNAQPAKTTPHRLLSFEAGTPAPPFSERLDLFCELSENNSRRVR
jgi:hypothetical protein